MAKKKKTVIKQIIPLPIRVTAVYDAAVNGGSGELYEEPVLLAGLDADGNVHFLSADDQGDFWKPSTIPGFSHFSFD